MRVGTIAVRAELPATASHITDSQIQEALWNYYYDIEKTVGYLTSTYITKPKAKKQDTAKMVKKLEGGSFSILDAGVVYENGFGAGGLHFATWVSSNDLAHRYQSVIQ
jgi:elongation factor 1 alpha-like protein